MSDHSSMPTARPETTRLAPSPTGALHLGNARTFLIAWALARRAGWRIVLRIEDLDGPRIKPGAADDIVRTLEWLGMDWDEGPLIQSATPEPHEEAMGALARAGLAYPSDLTRTQIEAAASAPQAERGGEIVGAESRFPPELRPEGFDAPKEFDPAQSWRFVTPDEETVVEDAFMGARAVRVQRTIGDFVIWTRRGQPAYQLAVVVDDHRQGITRVVRGDDLLDSAARQMLLYRALGLGPVPGHCHLPLVVGPDGRRLAKRHGDTRVDEYRRLGAPAERLIGLVAFWSGVRERRAPMSAAEFRDGLALRTIPAGPITFTAEDDQWLRSG